MHANSNPSTSHVKKRQLIKKKDGTFLGSPENSDPDEIILASEASIRSLAVSPIPMTVSDATFQTNMTVAAGLYRIFFCTVRPRLLRTLLVRIFL